jgi:hypothetical protein
MRVWKSIIRHLAMLLFEPVHIFAKSVRVQADDSDLRHAGTARWRPAMLAADTLSGPAFG